MPILHPKRNFSEKQRKAIHKRDKGNCQIADKCDGEKIALKNAHIDHIKPHAKGGPTTIKNGQVACPDCNLAKGDKIIKKKAVAKPKPAAKKKAVAKPKPAAKKKAPAKKR